MNELELIHLEFVEFYNHKKENPDPLIEEYDIIEGVIDFMVWAYGQYGINRDKEKLINRLSIAAKFAREEIRKDV